MKTENIEFVVAPYEADSQLAYLSTLEPDQGGISAVITEDSDLMAYGCQAVMMILTSSLNQKLMVFVCLIIFYPVSADYF